MSTKTKRKTNILPERNNTAR